jgi:serine/threonine protein phosphatase PrpC
VLCENAFAGVKRYNIVAQVDRNRVTNFDDRLMLVSAGLWNFYLKETTLVYCDRTLIATALRPELV